MANSDAPRGLTPVRYASGAPYNGAANKYFIPATDGTAVYIGGLVKLAGSADSDGVPTVTGNVSTGDAVRGVVVAFDAMEGAGADGRDSTVYRVASTARYVYVADSRDLLFEVQEDGALAAGDTGEVADLTGLTSGSTVTGRSSIEISSSTSTGSGDGTEDVVLVGLVRRPDNEFGTNAKWLVRLNNYDHIDGYTGV